jgi:uncharacterized membrane protein YgcG
MNRWTLRILAACGALSAALLAIAINAATVALPPALGRHPGRAWALVGLLTVATIACALLSSSNREKKSGDGGSSSVGGGIHSGGDLRIEGTGHRIAGGNQVTIASPGAAKARHRPDRH